MHTTCIHSSRARLQLISLHLRLGLIHTGSGISSVSHATLKNGLGFPKRLFSILALFIAFLLPYITLRLTVGTSAFWSFLPNPTIPKTYV